MTNFDPWPKIHPQIENKIDTIEYVIDLNYVSTVGYGKNPRGLEHIFTTKMGVTVCFLIRCHLII